jgi:hypothetical protein
VQVIRGIFTVQLDFGLAVFDGSARYLEISIRPTGNSSPHVILGPRQPVTATPYAMRSVSAAVADTATLLGGQPASGFIQNTTTQQSSTNFNIGGNGTVGGTLAVGVVNAATQYSVGGVRMLAASGPLNDLSTMLALSNTFLGESAGVNTMPSATLNSNTGKLNSFFGANAGKANTSGNSNAFFGAKAGEANTTGTLNSFVGVYAGSINTTGGDNSFVGAFAGRANMTGSENSFVGVGAGQSNGAGSRNTFIGLGTGNDNTTGNSNTMIGHFAGVAGNSLDHATAIGANAVVSASNSIVLGRSDSNLDKVGIGTSAPAARLHIRANTGNLLLGDSGCGTQFNGFGFGSSLTCNNYSMLGDGTNTFINRATGGSILFREGNNDQLIINSGGIVTLFGLGAAGTPQATLCRNSSSQIAFCSSSRRYKTKIEPYKEGLSLVTRLNPVSFNWKATNQPDIGLIAEDVAEAEPRLAYRNEKGEIEGVSYSQMSVVLINAVKEQQGQITQQAELIRRQDERMKQQQADIDTLKKLVCKSHPDAETCR